MKKIVTFILTLTLLIQTSILNVNAKEPQPSISADGAVLMDASTGNILYSKNIDLPYPPASTTKIMTALLTFENCKLDDMVKIGKNPPNADGSKIYIYKDEEIKVRDLLYGLLLVSGNDCAEALAEHIGGGSIDNFVKMMNKRAKELGCKTTNFVNPSGLYDDHHRTSAYDLALIMRELVKQPGYTEIATTSSYNIAPTNKSAKPRPLWNENKLVQKSYRGYYEGIEGGKTGYTVQSEHSYLASATRNNQRLIAVVLHDKNKMFFTDVPNLLNYGFKNFELDTLFAKGAVVTVYKKDGLEIPLTAYEDFKYTKEKGDTAVPTFKVKDEDLTSKSFKTGDTILMADVIFKNKNIGTLKLASGIDHEFKKSLGISVSNATSSQNTTLYMTLCSAAILIGSVIFIKVKFNKNKRF